MYCGVSKFNARNRATNITFDDLNGLLRLAHSKDCELFLTLNILIVDSEIPDLLRLLSRLVNTSIDGVIIQDLGLFYLLSTYFKGLNIHASTQLTTHNAGQISFLHELKASRVNLSRELNLEEIFSLSTHAHSKAMLTEVFVHGSYCISYSGLCYMSSLHGGNSGNRGRCSQPCRDLYDETAQGKNFPLNLKDNSAYFDLKDLADAGVDSFKIEGRIKKYHYVYTVVERYKKQLERIYDGLSLSLDRESLYKVFNRDFSNGFLKGNMGREMFIDNARDHSSLHMAQLRGEVSVEAIEKAENDLYEEKGRMRTRIKSLIDQMSAGKAPLSVYVSGKEGEPLRVDIRTPDSSFTVSSKTRLSIRDKLLLDEKEFLKRFKAINETEFFIKELELKDLQKGLNIPFSELTTMKNSILFFLRDSKEHINPVKIAALKRPSSPASAPTLSVLISNERELELCGETSAKIYFQLPDAPSGNVETLLGFLQKNRNITPCFPPVLIGKDYDAALKLLRELHPEQIVTDNSGLAFEAKKLGISWIAGPRLNIVNSYGLLCLKERFNCSGAFLSNELNQQQIRAIRAPENFRLYYNIFSPIDLMTSRQCLFQQLGGCAKLSVNEECIPNCSKSSSISNESKGTLFIEKTAGNYNRVYNGSAYLNTDIVGDMPEVFAGFLIDLREIKTSTIVSGDPSATIKLFQDLLKGRPKAAQKIHEAIEISTNSQYKVGI